MHVPLDERFLEWAERAIGTERLVQMIRDDLTCKAAPRTQTEFLNELRIRGHWQRAIVGGAIRSYADLATVIRVAQLPVRVDTRRPWHLVRPNDELAIVVGARAVNIPEVSSEVRQRGIGARDAEAQATFANVCRRLRLDADLVPHVLPSELAPAAAQRYLDDLCDPNERPNVGAVVVLGSPVVNPLAEPLARRALGGQRSPARFRWGFDPGPDTLLSVPGEPDADAEEEGITIDIPEPILFRRTRDDAILPQLTGGPNGPFPDCGLLLIDASRRPLGILCAGHGGCGTIAAVETLGDHGLVARLLAASSDDARSLYKDRVLVVVAVDRHSRGGMGVPGSRIDDLVITGHRVVWSSALIEELDV
jgi:hypothetical protein